ncbi:MAG: HAMP domain-containing sensor histidine kinase [Polyangiaceae bacterium]
MPDQRQKASDRTIHDQAEANEKLVLATIRSEEAADSAREQTLSATGEMNVLRANEIELLATAEYRELMMAILGHDLRSPLNAISLGAQLLMNGRGVDEPDTKVLKRIVSSSERMSRMIVELLDFTRARLGGGFLLSRTQTDLGELCSNIVDEVRVGAPVEIRLSVGKHVNGHWDSDRIAEVISNIVSNAVAHATVGTAVTLDVRAEDDGVSASITNHGVTIAPELLEAIFLPFRRGAERPAQRDGHLGLGLYIAYEIVRAHGGTLGVRSSEGTTTFLLALPRCWPSTLDISA